jgi:hypothetical protein
MRCFTVLDPVVEGVTGCDYLYPGEVDDVIVSSWVSGRPK